MVVNVHNVAQEGVVGGLNAEVRVKVVADGDVQHADGERLAVRGATTATLYVAAATNYVNYHDVSGDAAAKNRRVLDLLSGMDYGQLRERHVKCYREQFNRVVLELGTPRHSTSIRQHPIPTDQRLAAFDGSDLDLVTLMAQYGRYLLISSSQPGGQAANLQGFRDSLGAEEETPAAPVTTGDRVTYSEEKTTSDVNISVAPEKGSTAHIVGAAPDVDIKMLPSGAF